MYEVWQNDWQAHPHCCMSKNFLPKPSKAKNRLILHLSRGQMRRLIELITGHSNLNYVPSKIDPINISPLCHFCEEEHDTFAHLLNKCPCFISFCRDILHTLCWTTHQFLQFFYIPGIDNTLSFDIYQE